MSHYTLQQIIVLIDLAKEQKLANCKILDKYEYDEVLSIANGIGADWMPESLRSLIDTLNPTLKAVALIHDVEFYEGGTREQFHSSNCRFYDNGIKAAKSTYGWYNPLRYHVMWQAWKYWRLLDEFGLWAWETEPAIIDETAPKGVIEGK
jgi:hypothetical protein